MSIVAGARQGRAGLPAGEPTLHTDPGLDAELLHRARSGDDEAFGRLVVRHSRAMLAIAYGVVADLDEAEDICQDALFRAWSRLGECREPGKFAAWLGRAVHRHALNALRRRRPVSLESVGPLTDAGPGPDRHAEQRELRQRLVESLERLPQGQRQAVLLHEEGWSHAAIAEALGTTEAMSRQHLMLGRRRLRSLLKGEPE